MLVRTLIPRGATPSADVPRVFRNGGTAAFSSDGRLLATSLLGPSSVVIIWDVAQRRELLRIPGDRVVGFDTAGSRVAAMHVDGGKVTVAEIATGRQRLLERVPWHARPVPFAASGPHPWRVASASGIGASSTLDGAVTLWDTQTGIQLARLAVPDAYESSALAFDRSGRLLAVVSAGGSVSLVDVSPTSWLAHACALAGRPLTREELRQHGVPSATTHACTRLRPSGP